MSNYIATLLVLLGIVIIPTGFAQVHVVAQLKQELRQIQADAVKKLEATGSIPIDKAKMNMQAFVREEIAAKKYRLSEQKLGITIVRSGGISTNELTYNDEFVVTITYQRPLLASFFSDRRDFHFEMAGTMEPLPYDVTP